MDTGLDLSKAIEGFLPACRGRRLSPNTLIDYSKTLDRFLTIAGDVPLMTITPAQISAFLAAQAFNAKTVLNYHIGLSALWTWAIREDYVECHVLRLVEKPRPQLVAVVPFTGTDVKTMLASVKAHKDRNRALLLVLLDTGLRASELSGLQRDDIDLVNRCLKVLGKSNKERLLPFSPRTGSALFRYLAGSEGKPFPFTRKSLAHLVQRIGKRAGISANPHRFGHTFAIMYLRNGGDPYTLQEILGHSSMEMVQRYIALAQEDIDAAHRRASPVEGWPL